MIYEVNVKKCLRKYPSILTQEMSFGKRVSKREKVDKAEGL